MGRFILIASFFCTFCASTMLGQSQVDDLKFYKNELGINVTNLLANVFSLSNDNISTPYTFLYRRNFNKNVGMRFGLGSNYRNDKEILSGVDVFVKSYTFSSRVGLERILQVAPKVDFVLGAECIFGRTSEKSDAQGLILHKTISQSGGGPVIRIQFHINERVTLMTEALFYFVSETAKREEFDPITGIATYKTYSKQFSLTEPQALFISFKF